MRGQPPRGPGGLIHGSVHDRVAKAKPAAAAVSRADQVARQQLVERHQHVFVAQLRRARQQSGIKWLAQHGGRLEHRALVRCKGLELALDRSGDGRGNILLGNGGLIRRSGEVRAAAGSRTELL